MHACVCPVPTPDAVIVICLALPCPHDDFPPAQCVPVVLARYEYIKK